MSVASIATPPMLDELQFTIWAWSRIVCGSAKTFDRLCHYFGTLLRVSRLKNSFEHNDGARLSS